MLVTLETLARSFFLSEDILSVRWTMRHTHKHRLRGKSTQDCTEKPFDSTPTLRTVDEHQHYSREEIKVQYGTGEEIYVNVLAYWSQLLTSLWRWLRPSTTER